MRQPTKDAPGHRLRFPPPCCNPALRYLWPSLGGQQVDFAVARPLPHEAAVRRYLGVHWAPDVDGEEVTREGPDGRLRATPVRAPRSGPPDPFFVPRLPLHALASRPRTQHPRV